MSELQGSQLLRPSDEGDHVDRVRAQWRDARPDLDTESFAIVGRLGRATAYIDAAISAWLADFDLTRASWDVLASLRRSGPPHRLSPTQLYRSAMRSSGAMTHRLAALERDGLIGRVPDPADGRGMLVELTPSGVALVDEVAPVHLANEAELLAALSPDEQRALAASLRTLLLALERRHATPPPSGSGGRRRGPLP